jgi:hypothetical protein
MRTLYYGRDSNPLCLTQMIQISDNFFPSPVKTLEIDQIQRHLATGRHKIPRRTYIIYTNQGLVMVPPLTTRSAVVGGCIEPEVLDLRLGIGISHPFRNTAHHELHPVASPKGLCCADPRTRTANLPIKSRAL